MENREIEYFDNLWNESHPKDGVKHTRETWDRLAEGWNDDPAEVRKQKDKQCDDVTEFFVERGILTKDSEVVDIGCGAGTYAVRFAQKAKSVTCTDISPKMLDICKKTADEAGISNVKCIECDFLEYDASAWADRFDLVFTSLTPAMSGAKSVEKVNGISRGWCFNNSFVYRKDNIRNAVMKDVFGKEPTNKWGNSSVYCLFNILWHMGFLPELKYYKEIIEYDYDLTYDFAKAVVVNIIRDRAPTDEEVKRTLDYLERNMSADGKIKKVTESLYGWTLWNVKEGRA